MKYITNENQSDNVILGSKSINPAEVDNAVLYANKIKYNNDKDKQEKLEMSYKKRLNIKEIDKYVNG